MKKALRSVPGLEELVEKNHPTLKGDEKLFMMEFALHGLAEFSLIGKARLERSTQFRDLLSGMFEMEGFEDEDEDEDKWG